MPPITRPLAAGLALAAFAAALPGAVVAQDVIRPGDGAMTCEAMAREINDLSRQHARQQAQQARAAQPRAQGGGFGGLLRSLRPALDAVVSETGGDTMVAASLARSAIDSADSTPVSPSPAPRAAPTAPAAPVVSVASMRLERLNDLYAQRGC